MKLFLFTVEGPYFLPLISQELPKAQPRRKVEKVEKAKNKQNKHDYRRFHSIFTSSSWSPMGKRSNNIDLNSETEDVIDFNENLEDLFNFYNFLHTKYEGKEISPELYNAVKEIQDSLVSLIMRNLESEDNLVETPSKLVDLESALSLEELANSYSDFSELPNLPNKRSTVFASQGWGAGGVAVGSYQPSNFNYKYRKPLPSVNYRKSNATPRITIVSKGPGSYRKDFANSMPVNPKWRTSGGGFAPMFHLFASSGWGPSGRR